MRKGKLVWYFLRIKQGQAVWIASADETRGWLTQEKGGSIQLEQQESIIRGKDFRQRRIFSSSQNPLCSSASPALLARVKFAEKGKKMEGHDLQLLGFFVRVVEQVALTTPQLFFSRRATLHQPQTLTEEDFGSFRLMPIFFYIYVNCKYTYLKWETLPTTNPRWFWTMNNRLGKFKRSTSDLSWGFNVEFLFFCCHDLKYLNKTHDT